MKYKCELLVPVFKHCFPTGGIRFLKIFLTKTVPDHSFQRSSAVIYFLSFTQLTCSIRCHRCPVNVLLLAFQANYQILYFVFHCDNQIYKTHSLEIGSPSKWKCRHSFTFEATFCLIILSTMPTSVFRNLFICFPHFILEFNEPINTLHILHVLYTSYFIKN